LANLTRHLTTLNVQNLLRQFQIEREKEETALTRKTGALKQIKDFEGAGEDWLAELWRKGKS